MKSANVNIIVLKIGGSTLGQHDTALADIAEMQKRGQEVVVVHGGGKIITEWLTKQGAASRFVHGERVTDKSGLDVVTAVLAGLVNKELTAAIHHFGGIAVGLSGVDGLMLKGKVKDPALGFVGEIIEVDTQVITALLKAGYIPVISSIGLNLEPADAESPLLLNINADTAAGEIAATLGAQKLVFLTDVPGISDQSGQVIQRLTVSQAEALIKAGTASGGMIPKIRAGIRALTCGNAARIIDGRQSHAFLQEIENGNGGTTIVRD
jgi:acetylglutamate kinase